MKELKERLTELEIRSTHQEHLIDELNDVILDHNKQISDLNREVGRLRQMLQNLEPESLPSPDE